MTDAPRPHYLVLPGSDEIHVYHATTASDAFARLLTGAGVQVNMPEITETPYQSAFVDVAYRGVAARVWTDLTRCIAERALDRADGILTQAHHPQGGTP